jgi:uncharacterized membrane protein YfcA
MALIWTTYAENFTGAASLSGPVAAWLPMLSLRMRLTWPNLRRWAHGGAQACVVTGLALAAIVCLVFPTPDELPARLMMGVILLAAVLACLAGFAFSAIAGAVLFHLSADTVHMVQIIMLCSIANQAAMTWAVRRDIDWRCLSLFLAAGLMGAPVGVCLLLHVDHAIFGYGLGTLLVLYGSYMLCRQPVPLLRHRPAVDLLIAGMSGVLGGVAGFPTGLLAIWCGMKGWDKARQRAVCQPFTLLMQLASLLLISAFRLGGPAAGFHPSDLLFVPASLLGAAIGFGLYRRLSDRQFARCINVSLLVSGLSFVI